VARYTYLAADLRTNAILAELPLNQVDFTTRLDDIGHLRGKINLFDPGANKVSNYLQNATQPGRTALYVDRDGVLLWGGIVWTDRYTASTGELELQAMDFFSYFDHRYLTANVAQVSGSAAYDQFAIVQALVNWLQGVGGGNIGIQVGSNASGVLRTITYNPYEYKLIGDAVRELAALDQGFDVAVDVAYNPSGVPTKTLTLSYPRRGAVQTSSGWMFEHEVSGWYSTPAGIAAPDITGNVYDYIWPRDASEQGLTVYAVGAGSGASTLQSQYSTPGLIDAGYPLLERVFSYKDAKTQAELNAHATADGKALSNPVALPQLHVRPDLDPTLGTYTVGDDARVRILDFRFNSGVDARNNPIGPGIDTFYRIHEINVKAGYDQPEEVILTMGPTPL
jgi:hypothetical protein